MSADFNSTLHNNPTLDESETPMFAPIPTWERNRKRRGFGGGKRAAATVRAPEPEAASDVASPTYGARTAKRNNGAAPVAIAAGAIALAGIAAAGWYVAQPHGTQVAQLAPNDEIAASPPATPTAPYVATPPAAAETQIAPPVAAAPAPPVQTQAEPRRTERAETARARPAPAPAARSAQEAGVNTAATLPSAPMPYSSLGTTAEAPADVTAAPEPAAPVWNVPATPAPPPVQAAPEPAVPPAAATPPPIAPPQ